MPLHPIITRLSLLFLFNTTPLFLWADTIQTSVIPLKEVYANDFKIGCLLSYKHVGFSSDPVVPGQSQVLDTNGGYLIKYHMNSMSPGNNMKTAYTVNISESAAAYNAAGGAMEKDSIDTHPVVKFNSDIIAQLNWAQRQGFVFRGHTLVWHSSAPAAFFRTGYAESGTRVSKEVMLVRMENYIHEVIRIIHENWPGLLTAMDVVNEAMGDNGSFRTTNNEWYATFGDNSYVMKAFEFTRKYTLQYGETQLKLYYNDYNTDNTSKANGIVTLLTPIYEAGYLDGIGMQEHSSLTYPTAASFIVSYNKFYPICDEMAITEFDISTGSGTNTPSATILETQANQYANLFKCFVERSYYSGRGKIINVSKDGLNDKYTFVTNQSSSLWDINNQCKPAFYAVANVGLYYNRLDTLIRYSEGLDESGFSPQEWINLQNAISLSKTALTKNYSSSSSAVAGLENAITNILNPQTSAVTNELLLLDEAFVYSVDDRIYLRNIPLGSKISVISISGSTIQSIVSTTNNLQIPYSVSCIINISFGNEMKNFKIFHNF